MKKLLSLGILLIIINCANAQKRYLFKKEYLPNHIYKSTGEERLFPDININMEHFTVRTLSIETNQKSSTGNIPFKMFYTAELKFIPSQGIFSRLNPRLDKPVYGHIEGEKLSIDSVPDIKNQRGSNTDLARIINEFELDLSFPNKPLSIGESFTRSSAIQIIHIGGLYEIPLITTYKLLSVENDKAVFETKLSASFDFDSKGFKAKGAAKEKAN
jgi:hypothetical protein